MNKKLARKRVLGMLSEHLHENTAQIMTDDVMKSHSMYGHKTQFINISGHSLCGAKYSDECHLVIRLP